MKNLNVEAFDKFNRIPTSVLTEVTPGNSVNANDSLLSEAEILATNEHTNTSFIPNTSDGPNSPNTGTLPGTGPINPGMKLGATISGKFAVDMTDIILPAVLVWAVSALGYGIDKKALALTAKEKETLTPLVQAYLDSINVNFNNPLGNLIFGFAMIYGGKAIEVFPTATKLEKGKKAPDKTTVGKVVDLVKKERSTDEIIKVIGEKRKKGIKDAIEYFNSNKKKFGKELEPDIKLP
jgi:hypothetical protein